MSDDLLREALDLLSHDTDRHREDCRACELSSRIQQRLDSGGWMPIETAPKDGTWITVCSDTGIVWCDVRWEQMKRVPDRWTSCIGPLPFAPIRWMMRPTAQDLTQEKK